MSKAKKEGKKGKSRKSINKTIKLIENNNKLLRKFYDEIKTPS
jgi:predicted regulator of amino acid metabolism with ACT domain